MSSNLYIKLRRGRRESESQAISKIQEVSSGKTPAGYKQNLLEHNIKLKQLNVFSYILGSIISTL